MKERFERMTLDQLDAIREVLCYLYPPMESIENDIVSNLWNDLEEAIIHKAAEYHESDEYKVKKAEAEASYAAMFQPWKGESV